MARATAKPAVVADPPAPAERRNEDLIARLTALGAAANRDDEKAGELLAFCREHPEFWAQFANLEREAIDAWLVVLAPDQTSPGKAAWKRAQIEDQLTRRRTELQQEGHSQLEVLLINRILSAWLMTMVADQGYARFLASGGSFKAGEYHQKRLDGAQRQLLRAIKALVTVRRLLSPTQINIGHNQINVVG